MTIDYQFIYEEQIDLIYTSMCPLQNPLLPLFHDCNIHNLFYLVHVGVSQVLCQFRSRSYFDKVAGSRESELQAL
jgi:hypothetical protein